MSYLKEFISAVEELARVTNENELAPMIRKVLEQLASRDAEIAELKAVSDHNLKVYQAAAEKLRQRLADAGSVTGASNAVTHTQD